MASGSFFILFYSGCFDVCPRIGEEFPRGRNIWILHKRLHFRQNTSILKETGQR